MMKTDNWKILYCNVQSTRNFSKHNKGGCPISKGRIDGRTRKIGEREKGRGMEMEK